MLFHLVVSESYGLTVPGVLTSMLHVNTVSIETDWQVTSGRSIGIFASDSSLTGTSDLADIFFEDGTMSATIGKDQLAIDDEVGDAEVGVTYSGTLFLDARAMSGEINENLDGEARRGDDRDAIENESGSIIG